jgi:hypothetical protein
MRGPNYWGNQQCRQSGAAKFFTPVSIPNIPPGQTLAVVLDSLTHHNFSVINNPLQRAHREHLKSAFYRVVNPLQHEWLVSKPRGVNELMRLLDVLAGQNKLSHVVMVESGLVPASILNNPPKTSRVKL